MWNFQAMGIIECQCIMLLILITLQFQAHLQYNEVVATSTSFPRGSSSMLMSRMHIDNAVTAPAPTSDPELELLEQLLAGLEAVAEAVMEGASIDTEVGPEVQVRRVMCALMNVRMIGGGCTNYLTGPGILPPSAQCCRSVRAVFLAAAATPLSRRLLCTCFENDIQSPLFTTNAPTLLILPLRCGVPAFAALPLLLNPSTNCSV